MTQLSFARRCVLLAPFVTAACWPAPARAQEIPISDSARLHFSAGVRLLQDPGGARYEEAYQEFRVAYADSPSPRILGNIGLCAMKLERDEEAIHAFEDYLAKAPKVDAAERKQIEGDLGTLRASLVHVALTLPVADARVVDVRVPVQGAPVTNVYGPLRAGAVQLGIHPGHHTLTVKRDGYVPTAWEIDALPSATLAHTFELRSTSEAAVAPPAVPPVVPAPPPLVPVAQVLASDEVVVRPTPRYVWAASGVTVALAVVGIATGGAAVATRDQYNSINDGTRIPDAQSLHDRGQRLDVATDVLLGTALAGAVVTVILYATRPSMKREAPSVNPALSGGMGVSPIVNWPVAF